MLPPSAPHPSPSTKGPVEFAILQTDEEPCPYLPGQVARMPLRLPLGPLSGPAFDRLLEEGDRRAGPFLYRTACAACSACEPLRIPVARFAPTPSQRKVQRRNADLRIELGEPQVTRRHLELFNRHKIERSLGDKPSTATDYRLQFLETCVDTREVRYVADGTLVAVSLLDVGARAASSVYHYFDPSASKRSLGVFSVLAEVALCKALGLDWYYLGLYVAGCRSLRYKADYFPHERRIGGTWRTYERAPGPRTMHELFHEIADADCAAARRLAVERGLADRIAFRNLTYAEAREAFTSHGGTHLPALWDGGMLHEGLDAVVARLHAMEAE